METLSFPRWVRSKKPRELEEMLAWVEKSLFEYGLIDVVLAKNGKKWREHYLSKIEDQFKTRGMPGKTFDPQKEKLLDSFERLFEKNLNEPIEANISWGKYVVGYFVVMLIHAIETGGKRETSEPPEYMYG